MKKELHYEWYGLAVDNHDLSGPALLASAQFDGTRRYWVWMGERNGKGLS